jgi:hypothetical protein
MTQCSTTAGGVALSRQFDRDQGGAQPSPISASERMFSIRSSIRRQAFMRRAGSIA